MREEIDSNQFLRLNTISKIRSVKQLVCLLSLCTMPAAWSVCAAFLLLALQGVRGSTCNAGQFAANSDACANCAVGTWGAAKAASCTPCTAGRSVAAGAGTAVESCTATPLTDITIKEATWGTCSRL